MRTKVRLKLREGVIWLSKAFIRAYSSKIALRKAKRHFALLPSASIDLPCGEKMESREDEGQIAPLRAIEEPAPNQAVAVNGKLLLP